MRMQRPSSRIPGATLLIENGLDVPAYNSGWAGNNSPNSQNSPSTPSVSGTVRPPRGYHKEVACLPIPSFGHQSRFLPPLLPTFAETLGWFMVPHRIVGEFAAKRSGYNVRTKFRLQTSWTPIRPVGSYVCDPQKRPVQLITANSLQPGSGEESVQDELLTSAQIQPRTKDFEGQNVGRKGELINFIVE